MSVLSRLPRLLPDPSTATSHSAGRVVVAVHGTLSEPGIFRPLARSLAAQGVALLAPAHGLRGTAALRVSAADIARAVTCLPDAVDRVDVVAHSAGAPAALKALADPTVRERVGTLVGLGAAWRGTGPSRYPALLVRALAGDAFTDLAGSPRDVSTPEGVEVVSVVSTADTVVPLWSARLGRVIELNGIPHNGLVRRTDTVLSALGLPQPRPAA